MINIPFLITKTNNPYLEYLINSFLLTLLTYFFQNIKNYKNNVINNCISLLYKNSNYKEIILEAENVIYEKGNAKYSRLNYSKAFQAIIYHIKKIKPKDIYSKIEPDKNEKETKYFDIFIPNQNKSFLIGNTIECIIKIRENINKDDNSDIKKSHMIKIFSKDKNTTINEIEEFIEMCINEYKVFMDCQIYKNNFYFCYMNSEDNGDILHFSEKIFYTNKSFSTTFFEDKESYIEKLNFFMNNKEWYIKKGIPYHFGVFLYGEPGCGKSSIIKSTVKHTDRSVFSINLNRVRTCGEFENIFYESEVNNKNIPMDKRIYIFEDFDCLCDIVEERENKIDLKIKNDIEFLKKLSDLNIKEYNNPDDKLTLSCLLNVFDGILETPGRIIILTSNYPQKIDKAILRPGRIDINIEVKKAKSSIIREILSSFYEVELDDLINFKDYQLTPSTIINICKDNLTLEGAIKNIKKIE